MTFPEKTVLLVRPPSIMGAEHGHALQHPVGLCWLAAVARDHGFSPVIIDYEVTPYSKESFTKRIRELSPVLVGFTAMTPSMDMVSEMIAAASQASEAMIVLGGAHASILPRRTIEECPALDAVVMGEGEAVFAKLCAFAFAGVTVSAPIPGALLRNGDSIIGEESPAPPIDLDTLPIPARDLLDLSLYRGAPTPGLPQKKDAPATQLFTARGCPGKCIFCCSEHVFGRSVRSRSVAHIMLEVRDCMDRFGFRHFTIDNDTFTFDRAAVLEFCKEMKGLGVTWDCDTRVDRVDRELLRTMAESGCVKVAFGVETGSPRVLALIKKGITLEQVRKAFAWTREAGMLSCGFFMVGNYPDETEEDIRATRRFIREIRPDLITVAIATPYPSSELEAKMLEEGLMTEQPWSAYGQSFHGDPFSRTKTISAGRLKQLQSEMLRSFYLDPAYVLNRLSRIRSMDDVRYWISAGIQFVGFVFSRRKR